MEEPEDYDDWRKDPQLAALLVEGVPQVLKPTVDENGEALPEKKYAYVPAGTGQWAKLKKVDPCGHEIDAQRVYVQNLQRVEVPDDSAEDFTQQYRM